MVDILPFHGLRYNKDRVEDVGAVVAPPYDVITRLYRKQLYDQHPDNVVRLILGKQQDGDNADNNVYSRAKGFLKQWKAENVLVAEDQPAFYAYAQSWQEGDDTVERKGFVGLLRLEAFEDGNVLPHEFTLKGPKADRLNLMQATLANLSQIFMIYADPERRMEQWLFSENSEANWQTAKDADGVSHRFRPVTDAGVTGQLQALFQDRKILIADGHHRYETALAFRDEARRAMEAKTGRTYPPGSLMTDYIMVFLANIHDPGLKVYPTHRLLYHWPGGWDRTRFEAGLREAFDVVDAGEDFSCVFIADRKPEAPLKLKLKNPAAMADLKDERLKTLDTAILEHAVFRNILSTTGEALKADHTAGFYRNDHQIEELIQRGEAVCVFYMGTPPLSLIKEVCESGERMPQKSTYFYPKILTGLVMLDYTSRVHAGVREVTPLEPDLFRRFDPAAVIQPDA